MKKILIIILSLLLALALSACFGEPALKPEQSPYGPLEPVPSSFPVRTQVPKPTVSPRPTPLPTPIATPSPTPIIIEEKSCLVTAIRLNIRKKPEAESEALGQLPQGLIISAKNLGNGWQEIEYKGRSAYVSAEFSPTVVAARENHDLVDLRTYIKDIYAYMIFAYDENILGKAQYEADLCLLRKETADKLKIAAQLFADDGYKIKIYDAYRPLSVTKNLKSKYPNSPYVAQSSNGSRHNKGCAVDMTLVNSKGYELEMPSKMHTLDARSNRDNPLMTERQRKNMDYMARIMNKAGFTTIRSEWWHFDDSNHQKYQPMDLSIKDFIK